jgi:hypothetical protein
MHYPGHLRDRFCQWVTEGMPETATVEIDYEVMEEPARDFALRFLGCTDLMPRIEREHVEDLLDLVFDSVVDEDDPFLVVWDGTYHAAAYHYLRDGGMSGADLTDMAIRRVGVPAGPSEEAEESGPGDHLYEVEPGTYKRLKACTAEDLVAIQRLLEARMEELAREHAFIGELAEGMGVTASPTDT